MTLEEECIQNAWRNKSGKVHLEEKASDRTVILKWILRKLVVREGRR
jgi:hypothetical protein